MVKHVILWQLKDEYSAEQKAEIKAGIKANEGALLNGAPGTYTLSIEEAAAYCRIGEHKLRNLINENKNADYLLWNGNRVQIKRVKFEKYIDSINVI